MAKRRTIGMAEEALREKLEAKTAERATLNERLAVLVAEIRLLEEVLDDISDVNGDAGGDS